MNKSVDRIMYVWFLDFWVNYYKIVDIIELVYQVLLIIIMYLGVFVDIRIYFNIVCIKW